MYVCTLCMYCVYCVYVSACLPACVAFVSVRPCLPPRLSLIQCEGTTLTMLCHYEPHYMHALDTGQIADRVTGSKRSAQVPLLAGGYHQQKKAQEPAKKKWRPPNGMTYVPV